MECKEASLLDSLNDSYVFDDELGIVQLRIQGVYCITDERRYCVEETFVKNSDDRFVNLSFDYLKNNNWNKTDFFVRDPKKRNEYFYSYGDFDALPRGEENKIKLSSVEVVLEENIYYISSNRLSFKERSVVKRVFKTQKELLNSKAYKFTDFSCDKFVRPNYLTIKVGDQLFYSYKGRITVSKVYEYPSASNDFIEVKDEKGETFKLSYSEKNLYYLPYLKINHENPFSVLDKNKNELAIQPYLVSNGPIFNIYWKPIDSATRYIVSLYKIITFDGLDYLYHLKDYEVERNTHYLVVDGLIGNTFVFKVLAESREGEIIAESRGIKYGLPTYFVNQ